MYLGLVNEMVAIPVVVVVILGLSVSVSAANERCGGPVPLNLNTTCRESAFFWSPELQTCVNRSVCVLTDESFLSQDQCLKECRDNDRTQHKDCARRVSNRCSTSGPVPRPAMKYTYDHQLRDCKRIRFIRCPPEYLNGPNIFTSLTDCREFCDVRITTESSITTATTTPNTPSSSQLISGPESKPRPLAPVLSTAKVDQIDSNEDGRDTNSNVLDPSSRTDYGTGNFHPVIATQSASLHLTYHSLYLWTTSALLLATTV